jgi:ComF family protein
MLDAAARVNLEPTRALAGEPIMHQARSTLSAALRALLPLRCVFCGGAARGADLCQGCLDDLPGRLRPRCPVCAIPEPAAQTCGACLRDPPAYSRTVAAADYAFPLDAAVARLKYGPDLSLLAPLAHLIAGAVRLAPAADIVVPMPLSAAALRARGFNQATELARLVVPELNTALSVHGAARTRDTARQAALPFGQRTQNVRGAFACDGSVAGLRVAILDDVMTTGATVGELARTLRRAGAVDVTVWVLARTPRH